MKKTKKKLFTRVLSLVLVLAMCLGTPLTAKAATYDTSGVYAQSSDVNVTPNGNSFYADFTPSLNYLRNYFSTGETLVTVEWYGSTSQSISTTLDASVSSFTVSNLTGGIMYTVTIKTAYTTSSGSTSNSYDYVMYQVAGSYYSRENGEAPAPVVTPGAASSGDVTPVPTPEPTPTPDPTPAPTPAPEQISVPTPKISKVILQDTTLGVVVDDSIATQANGLEYRIYYKNGKNKFVNWKDKASSTYSTGFYVYGLSKSTTYYVTVRAWAYDSNYNKVYSNWSGKKYFVSQPKINANKSEKTIKANSVTLYWGKVQGATKYEVYCSSNKDKGYKRVASTKKTSAKITKFNGKTLKLNNSMKYFYVVAITKCGNKTIKSTPYNVTSCIRRVY